MEGREAFLRGGSHRGAMLQQNRGHQAAGKIIITYYLAGLRTRIHFIRIRILHLRLNTDPEPIRIRIQSGSRALMAKN
jgi:hypothetical protein